MTFTPADHVTEQEPGKWEDCTFAAVLETLRLSLPDGRRIPPTIEEVNAFRAATGLPDSHRGVNIEFTIPTAKRRYNLTDDQFHLTRDWNVLAPALEDPRAVCVVTGMMSAVPASERLTSFVGAHAVAKHGVRVRCDPLGPKDGRYQGNTWPLSTWKAFAFGLGGNWQALIMEASGGDGMISAGGLTLTSSKNAKIIAAGDLLDSPGGKRIAAAVTGRVYPYIGSSSAHRAVLVNTAIPYPDGVARSTVLYVKNAIAVIEDAPPAPGGDVKHKVTLVIDNVPKHTEEV